MNVNSAKATRSTKLAAGHATTPGLASTRPGFLHFALKDVAKGFGRQIGRLQGGMRSVPSVLNKVTKLEVGPLHSRCAVKSSRDRAGGSHALATRMRAALLKYATSDFRFFAVP